MAEAILTCNVTGCSKKITDHAYVTSCSHLFCRDHGQKMTKHDKIHGNCLVCGSKLSNEYDLRCTTLKPCDQYKSIMLSGLNPEQIMDIASRAISFFTYQMNFEIQMKDNMLKNVKRQNDDNCISITSVYKAEILKIQRFAETLKQEIEEKIKDIECHKQKIVRLVRENKQLQNKLETYKREINFHNSSRLEPPEKLPLRDFDNCNGSEAEMFSFNSSGGHKPYTFHPFN